MGYKIILTGSSGHIGTFLARSLIDKGQLFCIDLIDGYDITRRDIVTNLFDTIKPGIVIHCATYGNVRQCEADKKNAYLVNVQGAELIAQYSRDCGTYLIFFSTDYVFDGRKGWYKEEDQANPINYFGRTKRWAEEKILEINGENSLILRTSQVYGYLGPKKDNLDLWVIDNLLKGNKIEAFLNVYNTPTFIGDILEVIQKAINKRLIGLYHSAGSDRVSRFEFISALASCVGAPSELVGTTKLEDIEKVNRPLDVSLDSRVIQRILDFNFAGIEEGMAKSEYVKLIKKS